MSPTSAGEIRPRQAQRSTRDCSMGHVKLTRPVFQRHVRRSPYSQNIGLSELCYGILLTARANCTPFSVHIPDVVQNSAQKQMRWIYALRIVTMMQYPKPLGYGADIDHKRHSMSPKLLIGYIKKAVRKHRIPSPYRTSRGTPAPLPATFTFACRKTTFKPLKQGWIVRQIDYIVDIHLKPSNGFRCVGRDRARQTLSRPLFSSAAHGQVQA